MGCGSSKEAKANVDTQSFATKDRPECVGGSMASAATNFTTSNESDKARTSDTTVRSASETDGTSSDNGGTQEDASVHSTSSRASRSSTSGKSTGGIKESTSRICLELEDRRENLKEKVVHFEVPFGKPIEEVYSGVQNGPVLGSGISGLVRLVTHKKTGVNYAVKILDLGLIETEEGLQQLREEIFIMCQLDHPNIVRLEEVYESHSEIYLVQELCLGGELFDRLDEQPDYHYTEQQCARLVKQMLCAVRYIHSKGIVHRDLKLENFLFSTTSPDSELKMIDFGLSKHFTMGDKLQEAVGTPYTVAPEVIRGGYSEKCDVWAIGVITFLLLSGDPPFGGCGGPEPLTDVRANILSGSFTFEPQEIWVNVSQQARDFIKMLLVTNPDLRPTAAQAQKSPWLREWANAENKMKKGAGALNANVVNSLVNFKEYSDMRKLLCEVLSFTLLPDQIKDLRAEFEKMDTDGSGEITLSALKTVLMQNAGAGSLGALTEEEVEDIFNAMRVRKSEPTIQWHEFIAAGLSQCQVDDRNLRLAFDRLDSDHKGYISFDDVVDLMGGMTTEETLRLMYQDSLRKCASKHARITYEDFLLLMKGQTRESSVKGGFVEHSPIVSTRRVRRETLEQVQEESFNLEETSAGVPSVGAIPLMPSLAQDGAPGASLHVVPEVPSVGSTDHEDSGTEGTPKTQQLSCSAPAAVPETKSLSLAAYQQNLELDGGPLSFDDEDEIVGLGGNQIQNARAILNSSSSVVAEDKNEPIDAPPTPIDLQKVSANVELAMKRLTEPESPPTLITPNPVVQISTVPAKLSPLNRRFRQRSKSADERDSDGSASITSARDDEPARTGHHNASDHVPDSVRSVPAYLHAPDSVRSESMFLHTHESLRSVTLPEHGNEGDAIIEGLIKDESKTPLVVNRELYRAHRRMRLAVLDASKRFEEKQLIRLAGEETKPTSGSNRAGAPAAGLVMRRGQTRQLSSESVRHLLHQKQKETQEQLDMGFRKSGRGRRARKKTVSDMSAMMASPVASASS